MTNNVSKIRLKARMISAAIILFVAVAPVIYAILGISWSNFKPDIFTIGVPICYLMAVICVVLSVFGIKGPEIISEVKNKKFQKTSIKNNFIIFAFLFQIYGFIHLLLLYEYFYVNLILFYNITLFLFAIIVLLMAKNNKLISKIGKFPEKIKRNKLLIFLTKEF